MESGIIKIDVPEINFGGIPLTSDISLQTSHIANNVRHIRIERYNFASEKHQKSASKLSHGVRQSFQRGCAKPLTPKSQHSRRSADGPILII
jgi:hypothetical protein